VTTDTYDADGQVTKVGRDFPLHSGEIRQAVASFKGRIWQTPPLYSAIKYQGKRLYQYARANQMPERTPREVEIKEIELVEMNMPYVGLRIRCSKGTYVRSLAHDLGEKLGCGAHLFFLRRTKVGGFTLKEALGLEEISDLQVKDRVQDFLISIEEALAHLPSIVADRWFAERVQHGVALEPKSVLRLEGDFHAHQTVSVKDEAKKIIAIGKALGSAKDFLDLKCNHRLFEYLRVI
jgi:tRNA pseudouridine55 synthase